MVAAAGLIGASAEPAPDIYLLAGQSNMSGRGALSELTEAEVRGDPEVRLYGNDGQTRVATEPVDDATGQLDRVSADRQAGVGPGLFFARALRKRRPAPILLVPCARGGTPIEQWRPGGGRETLYGSCIARAQAAGGRIAGLLWYQGESDADATDEATQWRSRFLTLIVAFRRDLAAPRLPVVFVQLADRGMRADRAARFHAWDTVRQAQAAIRMPCVRMVSAAGLPLAEDELHLTTAAQRELGPRLAGAMAALRRSDCR